MKKENIKIEVKEGVQMLVIREDAPAIVHDKNVISVTGVIDSALRYIEKRLSRIDQLSAMIFINRDQLKISLIVDEENHYRATVSGSMKINPDFIKFKINTGESRNTHELAEFIKMNRSFFDSRDAAMNLVTKLRNFTAKVEKELENSINQKGDRKVLVSQVVESNIPESFSLSIPLIQGGKKEKIIVEVVVAPNDYSCTLVSPDAKETLDYLRDTIIDEQIQAIKAIAPEIVMIEQ